MNITLLLRSPGTGYSIESLVAGIGQELAREPDCTVRVVPMPYVSRGIRSVWQNLRFVARLTRTSPADVYHITGDVHYLALVLPPSRTVLTIHDAITLHQNRHRPVRWLIFWLLWFYWPIRRAAVVTAVSDKTRQELRRYVGRRADAVVVVPNAPDPIFQYSPRPFRSKYPVLLQLGTAPHKNLPRLIDALTGLRCRLVLVGPLSPGLREQLNRCQIDYVSYTDLSQQAVFQLYTSCDIVTFVSVYEGFGMPILEANAVGRVVITADWQPMRSVAADAALVVDPVDVAAIRAGIVRLMTDEAYRNERIEAGLQNANRYSAAQMARDYRTVYTSIGSGNCR
ncbi:MULTISPECIES: glycosyltransferase family 4 protein [Spirosoma]|uniref:Glycosyltransferase family 1 protein n=1 Tax=Spirosoma sordidisoli TaxID=2502893 RepID=A0A4Q2UW75_9BACT|nr:MULTISPECIES: glycosyltransferase family 1 protein [Spirosoma]RYC72100.1 glycosyltransferase family 1 protein [Spirosoma sordidisoli]